MPKRRRVEMALVAALVSASLVACGSGGSDVEAVIGRAIERSTFTTTTTTSTTTTAPTTTPTTTAAPTTTDPIPAGPPKPASDPASMASRLVAAETTARSAESPAAQVAAASRQTQILYRQLARTPDWHESVYAAVGDLRPTVEANVAARLEFRSMHSKLSDTLPAWRIVDPAPAAELLAHYREGEATFGVPWNILAAINLVETGMGRIRGTSVAGAQGPMQFMPATWEAYGNGGDVNDVHDAIMGAARYLAANGGGSGNIDNALFRYNNSNRYVRGVKHYAAIMAADPRAFHVFYNWEVVYLSTLGDVWLPVGYEQTEKVPAADYIAAHPENHLGNATN